MSLSSVRSETALRSRLFSSPRSFRRFTCSVFSPPNSWRPIIRHLTHADLADCVHYVLALREQNIDLPQLRDDLFRLVSLPCQVLLDVKDIPQVGPLQWGRIRTPSHNRACRRSPFRNPIARSRTSSVRSGTTKRT